MAALLTCLDKSRSFKPTLDFAEGLGLSRPNLNLDGANRRRSCRVGRFEVKFQGFLQIIESLFFRLALAGYIEF